MLTWSLLILVKTESCYFTGIIIVGKINFIGGHQRWINPGSGSLKRGSGGSYRVISEVQNGSKS